MLHILLRFYPFQLPFFQLRRHLVLSVLWLLLWLIALGQIGRGFGIQDLFFNPSSGIYPTFYSTLAWGIAYGLFVIAYHLTTYLLDGHHAGFLVFEKRPFLTYALNNSLLPVVFWITCLHLYAGYHHSDPNFGSQLVGHVSGAIGLTAVLVILLDKLSQDIFRLRRTGILSPQRIYMNVAKARSFDHRLHYYLTLDGGLRRSTDFPLADKKALTNLLLRYHRNAFLVELILIFLITVWGYIQAAFHIYLPAAAAFLILWAILYMLIGAISFWLRQLGGWALFGLAAVAVILIHQNWLWESRSAYGLSYRFPAEYRGMQVRTEDSLALVACLEGWYKKQGGKVPLVWVQVSGGGWRSAFWSMINLQLLDSLSEGQLWRRCFAISGASGGLIGAATWREINLFSPQRRWDLSEGHFLTQDALNPVLSTAVVGIFAPALRFRDRLSGESHPMGREYAFEEALKRYSRSFGERRIGDYTSLERQGACPLLFITPALIPSGKQLLISSQPCSPLLRQGYIEELRQLVPDADHLRLTTALRMNASFPFILPAVRLPTVPPLEAVDAGAIDNFGEIISLRFLWNMREAIAQRASRIVLIEIRDLPPETPIESQSQRSALGDFVRRLGGLYSSLTGARQILTRFSYQILQDRYPIPIEKYTLAYMPSTGRIPPLGLSLHPLDQATMLNTLSESAHLKRLQTVIQAMK
ncbi:MAG: hypothetical protein RMK19_04845 [Bacteroidia bacterium]|nr:hypothetical protein [Bacteroidia bacterium]